MSLTTIQRRANRKRRIRARVIGSTDRPRLTVFLSLKRITAQIIDDSTSSTLVAAISKDGKNMKAATSVGSAIAAKAKEKGITQIVFDRNARKYHGRVKALAEAARKGGLIF